MSITIELSFNIDKNNITETTTLLSSLSESFNSTSSSFIYEVEGHNNTIDRNDCINIVEFDFNKQDIINYLKNINKYKFIKIDSIYDERKESMLIYASKKYLTLTSNPKIYNSSINPTNHISIIQAIENLL